MVIRFEVFEAAGKSSTADTVVLDAGLLEEAKLNAYDAGYSAGWEDAVAAQSADQSRMQADLARNFQALAFTYHEARGHVLHALHPLLNQIVGRVLPALARESLPAVVLETLMPMAERLADAPMKLVLNPIARPAVEALLARATGLPIAIEDEPTLNEGQVYLLCGTDETVVDLDRAVAEITAAARDFFELILKEKTNG